jgi:hypothetical protein
MSDVVKVFGRVFVLRGIAAAYVSADEAQAEMDPSVAQFHALRANMGSSRCDFNLVQMSTSFGHIARSLA